MYWRMTIHILKLQDVWTLNICTPCSSSWWLTSYKLHQTATYIRICPEGWPPMFWYMLTAYLFLDMSWQMTIPMFRYVLMNDHPCLNIFCGQIRIFRYVLTDDHPCCIHCYENHFTNMCNVCETKIGLDCKDMSYKVIIVLFQHTKITSRTKSKCHQQIFCSFFYNFQAKCLPSLSKQVSCYNLKLSLVCWNLFEPKNYWK